MGKFEASIAGKPITNFETNKVRALFAYLAAEADQAHSREELAGMLWPDDSQARALGSLRHALAALRKALGDHLAQPPYLLISRETVQINRQSDLQVDVWDFEDRASSNPQLFIPDLQSAIQLYSGPFLDGFYCDSDLFDKWVQTRREDLGRAFRELLDHLAQTYAEVGDHEASILAARRLLELEPWDEAAHRLVMRGLAGSGQRSAALAQYETCRQILKNELYIAPEPETQRLYEAIRKGTLGSIVDPLPADRNHLPANWLPLIGRERELERIAGLLSDPGCRLLTLVGPGGIGKTHLALEALARQAGNFQHGVYFISLAPFQSAGAIPRAIAQELGFIFDPGGEPTQELLDYLSKKELLLLLDNFEHLLDGAGLVTAIIKSAPKVKLVITTRARLNLLNEVLFPLDGLDFPTTHFKEYDQYTAVKLFLEGARRSNPNYKGVDGDWEAIGQICQRVQGMPLAVLLASGWMGMLSPSEILQEIESHSLDFLEADWQDVPERQRNMRLVFDHSYRLLSPREQEIFAGLSVFRGGFTLSSARAVTGMTLNELRGLVDKSLVQRSQVGRYLLHELLRQYAQEALDRSPTFRETTHDRHADFFSGALNGWWDDLRGSRQFVAIKELGVELENALAAWAWMVDHIQVERMTRAFFALINSTGYIYTSTSESETGRLLCQTAVEKLAPLVLPAPTAFVDGARLLVRIWYYQAGFFSQDLDLAIALLRQGENVLEPLESAGYDVRLEKAMLLSKMGLLFAPSRSVAEFRKLFDESLVLFREIGDDWMAARVLDHYGWWANSIGDFRGGRQMTIESLAIHQKLGDLLGMDAVRFGLIETAWQQLDFEESERMLRENLAMCQGSGNPHLIASSAGGLGRILVREGKFAEGQKLLAESYTGLDKLGATGLSSFYGLFMCEADVHLGKYQSVLTLSSIIQAFYRKNQKFNMIGWSLLLMGLAELGAGHPAEARQYLEESLSIYPENYVADRCICLAALACAQRALGMPGLAILSLQQALRFAVEKDKASVLLYALPPAALLLADQGQVERAAKLHALVSRYGYLASSRWYADVVGRELAALPAEVAAAAAAGAPARGRANDLKAAAEELLSEFQRQSKDISH